MSFHVLGLLHRRFAHKSWVLKRALVSIQIRQYQRLEYGESDVLKLGMRAGLSLCIVLELDPYDLIFGAHPETVEELRTRRPAKGNLKVRHKS